MGPAELRIEVAGSPAPGQVDLCTVHLPAGATVADALRASGLLQRLGWATEAGGLQAGLSVGVWGRVCEPTQLLHDRDRVEVCRGLQVDPKEARRLRYQKHRAQQTARQAARPAARMAPLSGSPKR